MNGVFHVNTFYFAPFQTFADKTKVQNNALTAIKSNFSAATEDFKDHGLYAVFIHN